MSTKQIVHTQSQGVRWDPDSAATVRDMIRHEDELNNQRITWVLTFEGFLFTALGFSNMKSTPFIVVLGVIGSLVALSGGSAIRSAHHAVRQILDDWDKNRPLDYNGPDVIGLHLVHHGFSKYLTLWYTLPVILVLSWILVIVLSYYKILSV